MSVILGKVTTISKKTLGKILFQKPCKTQVAFISGKTQSGKSIERPPPFPWREKSYTFWRALLDRTSFRFNENTKVIVVDGPIAAGKTEFAKSIATEFDMLHIPEATLDLIYINAYGYDTRKLDPLLPESCRSADLKDFLSDPKGIQTALFQILMYRARFMQYVDALAHLFNTGQGVVLERSPFGDFVFAEAMNKAGYISNGALDVYFDARRQSIVELMKPHLIIYLDVAPKIVQENIKKRGLAHEVNSKALTPGYLKDIDENYKHKYLREASKYSELLVYDWSSGGDPEMVVDDIEKINFERFSKHDTKLEDWIFYDEWRYADKRMKYTNERDLLIEYTNVPRFDCPELVIPPHDAKIKNDIFASAPGHKYIYGYNEDMGDKGILFKFKEYKEPRLGKLAK